MCTHTYMYKNAATCTWPATYTCMCAYKTRTMFHQQFLKCLLLCVWFPLIYNTRMHSSSRCNKNKTWFFDFMRKKLKHCSLRQMTCIITITQTFNSNIMLYMYLLLGFLQPGIISGHTYVYMYLCMIIKQLCLQCSSVFTLFLNGKCS